MKVAIIAPFYSYDAAYSLCSVVKNQLEMLVSNDVEVVFINTPPILMADSTLKRPATDDTIREWIKQEHPEPGRCLFLSSQPYVSYQDTVVRQALPQGSSIETIGPACNPNLFISVHLDNLARCLYAEGKRRKIH